MNKNEMNLAGIFGLARASNRGEIRHATGCNVGISTYAMPLHQFPLLVVSRPRATAFPGSTYALRV